MEPRISFVTLGVRDLGRATAFYRDVLGAELVERGANGWAYRFGSQQLNLHGPGVHPDPVARDPVRPGNSDLCFRWDGPIEELYDWSSATARLAAQAPQWEPGSAAGYHSLTQGFLVG